MPTLTFKELCRDDKILNSVIKSAYPIHFKTYLYDIANVKEKLLFFHIPANTYLNLGKKRLTFPDKHRFDKIELYCINGTIATLYGK